MSGAQSISARRAYGVQSAALGTGAVQRLRATARDAVARLTAPRAGRCRQDEVHSAGCSKPRFMAKGTGKRGRSCGERIRTSQERVRRLMREHGLQAPYRAGQHGPKAHDGTITTAA